MNNILILVESNTTGTGKHFIEAARTLGLRPILLAADPNRFDFVRELRDRVEVIEVDTKDLDALLGVVETLQTKNRIAGVTSSSEYAIGAAARVARQLGLPGPCPDVIQRCRSKLRQRQVLALNNVAVPRFLFISSPNEAVRAAENIGLPVVLKPTSGTGSILVRYCATKDEVAAHAHAIFSQSLSGDSDPGPGALVEEVVSGPEFSVETFDCEVVGITQKHMGTLPNFVEVGHDFPAPLLPEDRLAIKQCAKDALHVLQLNWGPAHSEIRLSPFGPRVIEVNPRLAGGMIPVLVRLACGVDLVRATLEKVIGESPLVACRKNGHASIRFVRAPERGILERVEGLAEAASVPNVAEAVIYKSIGASVEATGDFRSRLGHVIAESNSNNNAIEVADRALSLIKVNVVPSTPEDSNSKA